MIDNSQERLAALTKERLDDLTARRAGIPEDDALPATTTRGELAAIQQQRVELDRRIRAINAAVATQASLGSTEADERWRDQLTDWHDTCGSELLALPPRIRDAHTLGLQTNLTLSIRTIDFGPQRTLKDQVYDVTTLRLGELMREAGYEPVGADPDRSFAGTMPWRGGLIEVENRIVTLAAQREQAHAALEAALMSDEERARVDAESEARRDALNALPTRKTRGDGSQYDKYPDGRRVEVSS